MTLCLSAASGSLQRGRGRRQKCNDINHWQHPTTSAERNTEKSVHKAQLRHAMDLLEATTQLIGWRRSFNTAQSSIETKSMRFQKLIRWGNANVLSKTPKPLRNRHVVFFVILVVMHTLDVHARTFVSSLVHCIFMLLCSIVSLIHVCCDVSRNEYKIQ